MNKIINNESALTKTRKHTSLYTSLINNTVAAMVSLQIVRRSNSDLKNLGSGLVGVFGGYGCAS